jgi:ATP-dependent HslUV protease ATP-binding subunit HslU
MSDLTPEQILAELNKHIVGQNAAKRAVAIALRSRWRRQQVDERLRNEISPKNILMIGPTGVGKTEIARRLAKLVNAPFVKVEATKFTEVGYVGRDVESIIRELADMSIKITRDQEMEKVREQAEAAVEDRILNALLPPARHNPLQEEVSEEDSPARHLYRQKLRKGDLDDKEIELEMSANVGVEIMAPPGMEEMSSQLQGLFQSMGNDRTKTRKLKVKKARKLLFEEESSKFINEDEIKSHAIFNAEQNGIVFIDEIDKITGGGNSGGPNVSREGVQRDLLPIIEGCSVNTKYGVIKTDHVLFIASGAFQMSKPSDLIPELQGRLPIRVELSSLTVEDFVRILTEPKASLTAQSAALLATEGLTVKYTADGVQRIAEIAFQVNEKTENIGARRLHTVMERVMDDVSYRASDLKGETVIVNADFVNTQIGPESVEEDLSRYIL